MGPWMNYEFATNYIVDGANQVTESVPRLTSMVSGKEGNPT